MTTTATDAGDVSIRPAERADLFDVIRIERASFPQPWPFDAFERFVGDPGFLVAEATPGSVATARTQGFGARRPASVVGYVVADTTPNYGGEIGHVKDVAVHPEHRGRGIGTRLVERALGALATAGVDRAKLEVRESNDRALALYRRFGFDRHHVLRGYYGDGEDALVLVTEIG